MNAYEEDNKTVRDNKCVVLTGSTGCGKVREKPFKLALDSQQDIFSQDYNERKDCNERKENFNILVSQPRKIAAITNATRVAAGSSIAAQENQSGWQPDEGSILYYWCDPAETRQ
jgi:HrpA-like RNA helicase